MSRRGSFHEHDKRQTKASRFPKLITTSSEPLGTQLPEKVFSIMSSFSRSLAVFSESVLSGFAFAIGWVMAMVMLTAVMV